MANLLQTNKRKLPTCQSLCQQKDGWSGSNCWTRPSGAKNWHTQKRNKRLEKVEENKTVRDKVGGKYLILSLTEQQGPTLSMWWCHLQQPADNVYQCKWLLCLSFLAKHQEENLAKSPNSTCGPKVLWPRAKFLIPPSCSSSALRMSSNCPYRLLISAFARKNDFLSCLSSEVYLVVCEVRVSP